MSERAKKRLAQRQASKMKKRMIERVLSNSNGSNSAFSLSLLVDGWLALESDPGVFSLLIEDYGCSGVQVDEVYDLDQKFDSPILGFIFLFEWLDGQSSRTRSHKQLGDSDALTSGQITSNNNGSININNRSSSNNASTSSCNNSNIKIKDTSPSNQPRNLTDQQLSESQSTQSPWSYVKDEKIIGDMFFAKQMISNSCATHALISILLNCDYEKLNLGPTLTRLKEHTKVMDPENRGYAIGNLSELAKAHNCHASYSSLYEKSRSVSLPTCGMSYFISGNQRTSLQQARREAYHFVSFVPIKDRLYELDGLKNFPIDHGPISLKENWTEKFRNVIKRRLFGLDNDGNPTISNGIRYNLMAVVPDKRIVLQSQLKRLKCQLEAVNDNIMRLTETSVADLEIPNPPYSPLSNETLSASESGSVCEGSKDDDDDNDDLWSKNQSIDKYYFVKWITDDKSEPIRSNSLEDFSEKSSLDLRYLSARLAQEIEKVERSLKEEVDKRRKLKVDNSRRTHNYEPFIMTFLSLLAKHGNLADLIEKDLGLVTEESTNQNHAAQPKVSSNEPKVPAKPKYKYVKTGRPVGRPRKHPLVVPATANDSSTK